jgi:hypothetical protein
MDMISDQLNKIIEVHKETMEEVEQGEVFGVKGFRKALDDKFYAGLVKKVRLSLEEKKEMRYAPSDSGLYVIIKDNLRDLSCPYRDKEHYEHEI